MGYANCKRILNSAWHFSTACLFLVTAFYMYLFIISIYVLCTCAEQINYSPAADKSIKVYNSLLTKRFLQRFVRILKCLLTKSLSNSWALPQRLLSTLWSCLCVRSQMETMKRHLHTLLCPPPWQRDRLGNGIGWGGERKSQAISQHGTTMPLRLCS